MISPAPPAAEPSSRRTFASTLIGLIIGSIVIAGLQTAFTPRPGELAVYLKASHRMVQGEPIYRTDDGPAFSYPPFMAVPTIPLTWLSPHGALFAWNAANWFLCGYCLTLGASLFRRAVAPLDVSLKSFWFAAGMILSLRFLGSPLEYRSHDYLLAAMFISALAADVSGRSLAAGALCGLAAACKATPLMFLPVFLWRRQFGAATAFIVAAVIATLIPDLIFPADAARPWVRQWFDVFVSKVDTAGPAEAEGAWRAWNHLNQSLSGTIYRLFTPAPEGEFHQWNVCVWEASSQTRKLITLLVLGTIFTATIICAGLSDRNARSAWHRWSMVLCAMLLLSPMSSKQHFCVLAMPIMFAAFETFGAKKRSCAAAITLTIVFVLGSLAVKDLVGRPLGNRALAIGSLTWCAAACWCYSLMSHVFRSNQAEA